MGTQQNYRFDIQILRGFSVLAVVFFHAKEDFFPLGYLGVDIFFLISGFVITPLVLRIFVSTNTTLFASNLLDFYRRRFLRLAPALGFSLTLSAILLVIFAPIQELELGLKQGLSTLFLLGNAGALKFAGDYFQPNPNPLIHTWSLSVEVQIYLMAPILSGLILLISPTKKILKLVLPVVIMTASFISFLFPSLMSVHYQRLFPGYSAEIISFYSPFDRAWQFLLGSLVYIVGTNRRRRVLRIPESCYMILVVSLCLTLISGIINNSKFASIIVSAVSVLLISSRLLLKLPITLRNTLQWIGNRSYSIYLIHMPILYIAKYSTHTRIYSVDNRIIQTFVGVIITFLISNFIYSKVEQRYRLHNQKVIKDKRQIFVSVLIFVLSPTIIMSGLGFGAKNLYLNSINQLKKPTFESKVDLDCNGTRNKKSPCIIQSGQEKGLVLLVGDSFADQYAEAIVTASQKSNWTAALWAKDSCKFVLSNKSISGIDSDCLEHNNRILSWVRDKSPSLIIVSQYINNQNLMNDLKSSLENLEKSSAQILVINNQPIFRDNPFSRTVLSMILEKSPQKFVSKSEMDGSNLKISKDFGNWARANGMHTMNLSSILCDGFSCTRFSGGDWLYTDESHLSISGAALAIPLFEAVFQKLEMLS